MKIFKIQFLAFVAALLILSFTARHGLAQKSKEENVLNITSLQLGYPCPAIPYYHFIASVELPSSCMIEVEAAVDGKVLRETDVRRPADIADRNRLPISGRSPSGTSVSQDNTLYQDFLVIGWVKWQPGQSYQIRITVRMKKDLKVSPNDIVLTATREVKAPEGVAVFDRAWKNYK